MQVGSQVPRGEDAKPPGDRAALILSYFFAVGALVGRSVYSVR